MGRIVWDHEYDAHGTEVLYKAADAGNTTAIEILRARDARASLQQSYRLTVKAIERNSTATTFVDAVAGYVEKAVNQMEMRDAYAGLYARNHVVHAYRAGGLKAVLDAVAHYGARATAIAQARPETITSLARKFCV